MEAQAARMIPSACRSQRAAQSSTLAAPHENLAHDFNNQVRLALRTFLRDRVHQLLDISNTLMPVTDRLTAFVLDSGKRLRPAFCRAGWHCAGGDPLAPGIIGAAASLELLHACALIHDDIMDNSDTRRGGLSMHRQFVQLHQDARLRGSPELFGTAMAILLGDLCLTWCDEMFSICGLPTEAIGSAKRIFHMMYTEIIAGQCLDVLEQANGFSSVEQVHRVMLYKTAKYTIERPLHLGAVLAGGDEHLLRSCSEFALPLGEAFQLRDDILGIFGNPEATGKPVGDDIRAGKSNLLISFALDRSAKAQRHELETHFGNSQLDGQGLDRLREVIVTTGALLAAEQLIEKNTNTALSVLASAPMPSDAARSLADLAISATSREK